MGHLWVWTLLLGKDQAKEKEVQKICGLPSVDGSYILKILGILYVLVMQDLVSSCQYRFWELFQ